MHNSSFNFDHDDDVQDPDLVTRISKLDISDLLHLHPNDTTALTVVSIKLKGTENYQVWSCVMLLDLEGKIKIGFIDGSCKRSNTNEVLGKQWDMVNVIVLGWILNSLSDKLFLAQIFSKRAKHVWEELKETYDKEEKGVLLSTEHGDWLDDTDEEPDEHELEAHYMYMAKIHETVDSNVIPNSSYMCDNDEQVEQNAEEYEDERVVLANLIENLKLDHDKNKKIRNRLKKSNASRTHELNA
uniref:Ribonuclease H-like domain-containing protein n=1 Tax=Tanacetum cinerariifolium TaxID=118510 RepID=A0A699HPB1_TANCI|nr:ribonuclease H-like domain-containing protein [Tanacetum cinerariifolium]